MRFLHGISPKCNKRPTARQLLQGRCYQIGPNYTTRPWNSTTDIEHLLRKKLISNWSYELIQKMGYTLHIIRNAHGWVLLDCCASWQCFPLLRIGSSVSLKNVWTLYQRSFVAALWYCGYVCVLFWMMKDGHTVSSYMMTSSNGNIFRVTGHVYGEFTGLWWIPRLKASDAELWYFLWSASE